MVFHEIEFILFNSFSYIPVINATVPPEMPGIVSCPSSALDEYNDIAFVL